MITAAEARKRAEAVVEELCAEFRKECVSAIEQAIMNGKCEATVYPRKVSYENQQKVVDEFKQRGYSVSLLRGFHNDASVTFKF